MRYQNELEFNIKNINSLFDGIVPIDNKPLLKEIGTLVREDAIQKAPAKTGRLKTNIEYEIEDNTVFVGTNVFYAPFVEFGTGQYAEHGDGTSGYWVYVEKTYSGSEAFGSVPGLTGAKHYETLMEAKQCKAYLVSKGIPATQIHISNGMKASKFLERALHENEQTILQLAKDYYKGSINGRRK